MHIDLAFLHTGRIVAPGGDDLPRFLGSLGCGADGMGHDLTHCGLAAQEAGINEPVHSLYLPPFALGGVGRVDHGFLQCIATLSTPAHLLQ